jgi:hypothetical protein
MAGAAIAAVPIDGSAHIVRIQVDKIEKNAFDRQSFGSAGAYEVLTGRVHGELDPKHPRNAIIQDLALATRNARGMVEYSATFSLARPRDMAKASGVLIYQVSNRGGGGVQGSAEGHLSVVSGWQGDIAPAEGRQTIAVPTVKARGPVLARFINIAAGTSTVPIVAGSGRPVPRPAPVSLDTSRASLSWAASDTSPATPVPSSEWAFADCAGKPFPGTPDATKICVKGNFQPKRAYTLSYVAEDAKVLGVGYAAIRDLVSFLRHADADRDGTPNPAGGAARAAIGTGVSQSANVLRSMVHLDFNADEQGRPVFDGILPSSSLRQNALNFRFAVPGGGASLYDYGTEGVMWWSGYRDRLRGLRKASLLDRCTKSRTCPKVIEMFGASELWTLRGSPALVGTDARGDIPLPPNVRRYYNPGVTHTGGRGGFEREAAAMAACVLGANPNPASDTLRALTSALVDWVVRGVEPPASAYPTLDNGGLAEPREVSASFPKIPGVPAPLGALNPLPVYAYGPGFEAADLSGVMSLQPPRITAYVPLRVARIDADGNETAGVRSVLMRAPLGTYVGWNYAKDGYEEGRGCGSNGGFIPFAPTRAERIAAGDPRLSLEERYGSREAYAARVRLAAETLVKERLLLPDDAERIVGEAAKTQALDRLPVR